MPSWALLLTVFLTHHVRVVYPQYPKQIEVPSGLSPFSDNLLGQFSCRLTEERTLRQQVAQRGNPEGLAQAGLPRNACAYGTLDAYAGARQSFPANQKALYLR